MDGYGAGGKDSPLLWMAGIGLAGVTLVYIWALGDPMLVYLFLVTAIMAVFPTYRQIIAFVSLMGVYRIALRHDVIMGGFSSFVVSTGEGIDITVGGTAVVVTLMALWPAMKALTSFDVQTVIDTATPAIPLVILVLTRYFIESKADTDVTELTGAAIQHAKDFFKLIKVFTGMAR